MVHSHKNSDIVVIALDLK